MHGRDPVASFCRWSCGRRWSRSNTARMVFLLVHRCGVRFLRRSVSPSAQPWRRFGSTALNEACVSSGRASDSATCTCVATKVVSGMMFFFFWPMVQPSMVFLLAHRCGVRFLHRNFSPKRTTLAQVWQHHFEWSVCFFWPRFGLCSMCQSCPWHHCVFFWPIVRPSVAEGK